MVQTATTIWRDSVTDGIPASGAWNPRKADIREWATWVEAGLNAGTLNGPWKASLADLNADLAYDADTVGFVYDTADIGTYVKSGASGSGSWTKILDFIPGYQIAEATDDGNSTANAYTMNTSPHASASDGVTLIHGFIPVTNTSETVTITLDGGTALTFKTGSNNDPAVGGLVEGMPFIGKISGSGTTFRLLSDQASAAIQAAAEAAAAEAEAARDVATGAMTTVIDPQFSTIATAEAYSPDVAPDYIRTAGYSSAGDGGGALYKKVASEPSHAGKFSITLADGETVVWYELAESVITPLMLGAKGDGDGAGGGTDDAAAITSIMEAANAIGATEIDGLGRIYRIDSAISLDWDDITFVNAKFDMGAWAEDGNVFVGGGTIESAINLDSDAAKNVASIVLADASTIAAGDWMIIRSDKFWDIDEENVLGEIILAHEVDQGTDTVTLGWRLDYAFAMADSARVTKINPRKNIAFHNCEFYGSKTVELAAFRPSYVWGFRFRECKFWYFNRRAIGMDACWNVDIEGCTVFGIGDTTNYGVGITSGCHFVNVSRCWFHECRHGVATGGVDIINRHIKVTDCFSIGSRDAAFDCHRATDHVDFLNCTAEPKNVGASDGFLIQAARASVINCTVNGLTFNRNGIFFQSVLKGADRVHFKAIGNTISGSGQRGIYVLNDGGQSIDYIVVANNIVEGYAYGVHAKANTENCRGATITGNTFREITERCVHIQTAGAMTFHRGTIVGNACELTNDTNENILLGGGAANGILHWAVSANTILNGSYGIRGVNTDFINASGNVINGTGTSKVSLAGANSVDVNNI